jgi:sugar-phosphatase
MTGLTTGSSVARCRAATVARHACRVVAIAFDVDGVLIDSASVHRRVWAAWAESHGLDDDVVWRATFGRRPEDTVLGIGHGLDPVAERRALDRLLARHEHRIGALPGAKALLEGLGSTPWAVATSGSRVVTMERFHRLGLPLPPVGVFGEDVEHGKPAPECYLRASEQLGVSPADCIVVEDAPAGIAAGRAAGCWVLAVATTQPRGALAEADEVHENLQDVTGRLMALLPAAPEPPSR